MQQLRERLTYANVVATLALFLALAGGSAFAATQLAKNSVGTKQLKKNAVTAAKIKNGAITPAKLNPKIRTVLTGPRRPSVIGIQGPQGHTGPRGPSNAFYKYNNQAGVNSKTFSMTVPAGNFVVSASSYVSLKQDTGPARASCYLESPANTLDTEGSTTVTLYATAAEEIHNYHQTRAETVISLPAGGTIEWDCLKASGVGTVQFYQSRITAVQVESVHLP